MAKLRAVAIVAFFVAIVAALMGWEWWATPSFESRPSDPTCVRWHSVVEAGLDYDFQMGNLGWYYDTRAICDEWPPDPIPAIPETSLPTDPGGSGW